MESLKIPDDCPLKKDNVLNLVIAALRQVSVDAGDSVCRFCLLKRYLAGGRLEEETGLSPEGKQIFDDTERNPLTGLFTMRRGR